MNIVSESIATRKSRGRPRSIECHQAILTATTDLLEERRYAEVTMDAIAERAGVSKQTLYKWWAGKSKLTMEAMTFAAARRTPVPDTGNVKTDFIELLLHSFRWLNKCNGGATCAGLIAETQSDPELAADFRETYIAARRDVGRQILQRGIEKGEIKEETDVPFALDMLYGPVWYRLLLRHAPLDKAFAHALVSTWLQSITKAPPREARRGRA